MSRNAHHSLVALTTFLGVAFFSSAAALAQGQGLPCEDCGPGPHYLHTNCPAGFDIISDQTGLAGIDLDGDCQAEINLVLPSCGVPALTIERQLAADTSANFPVGTVDLHDDVVDTEILSLCLSDGFNTLRAGFGIGGIINRSYGTVLERASDPAEADSFFDVFFEVDLGGVLLYNQVALRVESDPNIPLTCLPPATTYLHIQGCVPLYTSPIMGQGVEIGNLVQAKHFVNAECYLLIGDSKGDDPFAPGAHLFQTLLGGIQQFQPVLLDNLASYPLPVQGSSAMGAGFSGPGRPSTLGTTGAAPSWMLDDGTFTVQVVMWNPYAFPNDPEQYTPGLKVYVAPDGSIQTRSYGSGTGMQVWHEIVVDGQGNKLIRFPFSIPGM